MAQTKVQKSASWGKRQLGEVPVGGSASWEKCQFGEVPVGESASWGLVPVGGQKFNPWTDGFFSNFVDGKNSTPFSASNDLK